MKETRKIAELANATAVDFGKLNEINEYVLELGPEMKIPGKVFGGSAVGATGGEFSSNRLRLAQKLVSSTSTRLTKNCISSSAAKESSKLTARCSTWRKVAW